MNEFYLVFNYIKESLEQTGLVNTITHGVVNDIDLEKKNIFPLSHVAVTGSQIDNGLVYFNFTIWCLDIRNISKEVSTDKFFKNDNEIDNLNTTFAILNKMLTKMKIQRNDLDIELQQATSPTPVQYDFTNILDGWSVDIQLSIPNNKIQVCN